jgi:hypothetical protein
VLSLVTTGLLGGCSSTRSTPVAETTVSQTPTADSVAEIAASTTSVESTNEPGIESEVKLLAKSGETLTVKYSAWFPNKLGEVYRFPSRQTAPSACDIDQSRDAFIPLRIEVRNTTVGFPVAVSLNLNLDPSSKLEVLGDQEFSGGSLKCQVKPSVFSIKWETPIEPDDTREAVAYLVVKNFYSPALPDGDVASLDSLLLKPGVLSSFPDGASYTLSGPTRPGSDGDAALVVPSVRGPSLPTTTLSTLPVTEMPDTPVAIRAARDGGCKGQSDLVIPNGSPWTANNVPFGVVFCDGTFTAFEMTTGNHWNTQPDVAGQYEVGGMQVAILENIHKPQEGLNPETDSQRLRLFAVNPTLEWEKIIPGSNLKIAAVNSAGIVLLQRAEPTTFDWCTPTGQPLVYDITGKQPYAFDTSIEWTDGFKMLDCKGNLRDVTTGKIEQNLGLLATASQFGTSTKRLRGELRPKNSKCAPFFVSGTRRQWPDSSINEVGNDLIATSFVNIWTGEEIVPKVMPGFVLGSLRRGLLFESDDELIYYTKQGRGWAISKKIAGKNRIENGTLVVFDSSNNAIIVNEADGTELSRMSSQIFFDIRTKIFEGISVTSADLYGSSYDASKSGLTPCS